MATEPNFKTDALKGIAAYSYVPRTFAYLAGLFVVVAVFQTNNSHYQDNPWIISALFIVCLTWPHIAYLWSQRSPQINKAVSYSLMFDSFFGGLWIPMMSFELVPCAVFITILMINNISAGGFKLLFQGLIAMAIATLITSALTSPEFNFESEFIIILFCVPLIIVYPMVLSFVNYKLTRLMIVQREKLLHISRNDGLTGVFTRRYWEQRLLEEFNRCRRSGEDACVMMVDIDHFKSINDNYGHLVGDNVLKQFGGLLKELRSSDIVGRYGGEEFSVLLPNSSFRESLLVAERLRKTIAESHFDQVGYCTVSIGIAPLDEHFPDAYKWLDSADKALYQAKSSGRNQVKSYQQGTIKNALAVTVSHDYI